MNIYHLSILEMVDMRMQDIYKKLLLKHEAAW